MAEPAQVPLSINLAAVAFGAIQGGVFGAAQAQRAQRLRHPRRGGLRARASGLGGEVVQPRRATWAGAGGAARRHLPRWWPCWPASRGCSSPRLAGRLRWTFDALDALVVGLFVVVGALKTQDAGLPGRRDHRARRDHRRRRRRAARPARPAPRAARAALDPVRAGGAARRRRVRRARRRAGAPNASVAAGACLVVVFAVRMLALARGWRSPAPVRRRAPAGLTPLSRAALICRDPDGRLEAGRAQRTHMGRAARGSAADDTEGDT